MAFIAINFEKYYNYYLDLQHRRHAMVVIKSFPRKR